MNPRIKRAADTLLGGGIITYPTEGVYGLGCLPDDPAALRRLLSIKRRDPSKGLILVAANALQFDGWVSESDLSKLPAPEPTTPITWIAEPGPLATSLVTGNHSGIAVRITTNPVARAICEASESPLVSTSANLAGRPVARNKYLLRRTFGRLVDYMVPGDCGPAMGPSEIRRLSDGAVLRPGKT